MELLCSVIKHGKLGNPQKKCVFFWIFHCHLWLPKRNHSNNPKEGRLLKKTIPYVSKYHYKHECMYCQKTKKNVFLFWRVSISHAMGLMMRWFITIHFFLTAWIVWNLANHKGELCQQITCNIMAKPPAGLLWKWWYSMFQNCHETMGIDGRDGLQKSLVMLGIYRNLPPQCTVRLSRMSSLKICWNHRSSNDMQMERFLCL